MIVTLDQLRPYEFNPRVMRNPNYDDIKASIRQRGLDTPPPITRRPDRTITSLPTAVIPACQSSMSYGKKLMMSGFGVFIAFTDRGVGRLNSLCMENCDV